MNPNDYYAHYESVLRTLTEVGSTLDAVQEYAAEHNLETYWRGQTNHHWGLTSSLVRQLTAVRVPDDTLLNDVEDRILKEGRQWVTELTEPRELKPLACLAYLQHHGVPTRLIDFTRNPWMAVFFAVQSDDKVDGRLFALLVDVDARLKSMPSGTPWRKYTTYDVKVFDPAESELEFPRLVAQEGVFVFGRLPSTRPHRMGWDAVLEERRSLLAEEVRRVLSIPFKLSGASPIPAGAAPPIGLTFRIHIDKESVRRDLSGERMGRRICPTKVRISSQGVFPDVGGMMAYSQLLIGLSKGWLIP